jgi:hypothetical protein
MRILTLLVGIMDVGLGVQNYYAGNTGFCIWDLFWSFICLYYFFRS